MTYKENIKAILECNFTGFKEEIIESACNRILEHEQEPKSPCDACRYNPPGSGDGKPCTMCPADATERFKNKLESGYFRKRRER